MDSSAPRPIVLAHVHIAQAMLDSPDEGRTLDFGRKQISIVTDEAVEELARIDRGDDTKLQRISLGYNSLATLPPSFASLARLRYLSLRGNGFVFIPDALTALPLLNVLDLSRNKIKHFPPEPGNLVKLKVLHIGRNQLTRLPAYFASFTELNMLKIDHNPLEWPPKWIMERKQDTETPEGMVHWISVLRKWISDQEQQHPRRSDEMHRSQAEQHATSEENHSVRPYEHGRSPSLESIGSHYSATSSRPSSPPSERPTPLLVPSYSSQSSSPSASPSISPDPSVSDDHVSYPSTDDTIVISHTPQSSTSSDVNVLTKPSLPELRAYKNPQKSRGAQIRDDNQPPISVTPFPTQPPDAPSMEVARHSYFKRLSTLLPSTLSRTVPPPLLKVVDCVRGILFALSQVYSSLRHYAIYAIDERLSGVLGRVLDPASTYLGHLITALDRFDSLSRAGIPPPLACRAVLESCKDNVAVFRKVVGVLQLQLKVLAGSEDIRYTRTLLLMLYGSTAEVSNSWKGMLPYIDSIQLLVRGSLPPPSSRVKARGPISPIEEEDSPRISTSRPSYGRKPATTRRHAGSFSSKDVQIGKALPLGVSPGLNSTVAPSISPSGLSTPLRSALRTPFPISLAIPPPGPGPSSPQPHSATSLSSLAHSRENSLSSFLGSSGAPLFSPNHFGRIRANSHTLDLPSDSSKLVDHDLLITLDKATDIAQSVWSMMAEVLSDSSGAQSSHQEKLAAAQTLTVKLRESIRGLLQGSESGPALLGDRKLWEQANMFLKTVVHLSTVIKPFAEKHLLSSTLRPAIVKLTQATHDAALLLAVSSFSPSSSGIRPTTSPAPNDNLAPLPNITKNGHYFHNHNKSYTHTSSNSSMHSHTSSFAARSSPAPGSLLGEDLITQLQPPLVISRNRSATADSSLRQKDIPWGGTPHQQSIKTTTPPRPLRNAGASSDALRFAGIVESGRS